MKNTTVKNATVKNATVKNATVKNIVSWGLSVSFSLLLSAGTLMAQDATVSPLLSKDLSQVPGKEISMIAVEYAPGGTDPVHTHHAHAMVYVLEGTIVMQVRGGTAVTLKPGDTFYEGPEDVHIVGKNASPTKPAKFVVFLVKDKGAPILVPVK